jgi:hypothetical protein
MILGHFEHAGLVSITVVAVVMWHCKRLGWSNFVQVLNCKSC